MSKLSTPTHPPVHVMTWTLRRQIVSKGLWCKLSLGCFRTRGDARLLSCSSWLLQLVCPAASVSLPSGRFPLAMFYLDSFYTLTSTEQPRLVARPSSAKYSKLRRRIQEFLAGCWGLCHAYAIGAPRAPVYVTSMSAINAPPYITNFTDRGTRAVKAFIKRVRHVT